MAFSQKSYDEQLARFHQMREYMKNGDPIKRIAIALGLDPRLDEDKQETFRWIGTVLSEVQKTLGDDKKDLTACTPDSFIQAMIDAATLKVPIDGRKLADLIPRGNLVQYQINTAGFVYLVGLHYEHANIKSGVVFEGDEFEINTIDGLDTYNHKPADPFMNDVKKMRGIYVALSYSKGGKQYQKVERLPKSEIDKIREKAKTAYVWNDWFFERAQTAAVKRICKRQFQTIMGLQEAIAYDNRHNYDMTNNALPAPSAGSIIDNLNAKLKPPTEKPKAIAHEPEIPMVIPSSKDDLHPVENQPSLEQIRRETAIPKPICSTCGGKGFYEDADGIGPCPDCGGKP